MTFPIPKGALDDRLERFISKRETVEVNGVSITKDVIRRMINKTDFSGDCWIWTGYAICGYGALSVHDHEIRCHRISLSWQDGQLGDGVCALHHCDVRRCWNPSHLFQGTQLENIADMHAKNRGTSPPVLLGEAHPLANLTNKQVSEIRLAMKIPGTKQREIARQFGCSQSTVWRIKHGKVRAHAHVKD